MGRKRAFSVCFHVGTEIAMCMSATILSRNPEPQNNLGTPQYGNAHHPPSNSSDAPFRGEANVPFPSMSYLQAEGRPDPFRPCKVACKRKRDILLALRTGDVVVWALSGRNGGPDRPMSVSSEGKRPNFPNAKKHARRLAPIGRAFGLLSSPGAWPCLPRRTIRRRASFPLPSRRAAYGKGVTVHLEELCTCASMHVEDVFTGVPI